MSKKKHSVTFSQNTGLDLTLEGDIPTLPGKRRSCGVLKCAETINASIFSSPFNDNDGSSVVLDSITGMSVFRIDSTISKLDDKNKRKNFIGSVTSQTPTLTQVANGRKVDGLLKAERATVRVELYKQKDCQADFICQVRGSDNKGREVVTSTTLVQHPGQKGNQLNNGIVVPGIQQLVSQSLESLGKKIESLEDRIGQLHKEVTNSVGLLKKELNDNIALLQKDFNDRTDSFERRLDTKLDFFENRVEEKINNINNLNKLDSKVSTELA